MAMTKKNIIVGAARVFVGPPTSDATVIAAGNSKPSYVANTRYSTTLGASVGGGDNVTATTVNNWREIGFTQDGLQVATDPSWGEVEVDQLLDSAKIFKNGMSLNISTTMAEATLENLLIAWGQAASTLSSVSATEKEVSIEGGNLGEFPIERGLVACGNAVENGGLNTYGERVYQAFRVISVEATSFTNSRSDAATIPVTLRALPADSGRYGAVRDRLNVS